MWRSSIESGYIDLHPGGKLEYRGLNLDGFQAEAIEALSRGQSVLVAAPTGTGKTLVADYIVDHALSTNKEVIYTAPIKALSNQKFRDYCGLHGEDKVGLVTGDLVIRRDAPCKVMTTEILRNMLLGGEKLEHLAAVVIDEIHFLDDADRGTVWEGCSSTSRSRRDRGSLPTLSSLKDFAAWLSEVRGEEVHVVIERERAVPLAFQVATKERGLVAAEDMDKVHKAGTVMPSRTCGISPSEKSHRGRQRGRGRGHWRSGQAEALAPHPTLPRLSDAPRVTGSPLPVLRLFSPARRVSRPRPRRRPQGGHHPDAS